MRASPPLRLLASFPLLLAAGCVGRLGGNAETTPAAAAAARPTTGRTPIRRLTRLEYNQTIRDLIGDTRRLGDLFSADALGPSGFSTGGTVSAVEAVDYLEAGERIAEAAMDRLDLLLPCKPQAVGEAACARAFIETFGKRAYRRPLTDEERGSLEALYAAAAREGEPFRGRIRAVLTAMLQSPAFLYRGELGASPKRRPGPLVPLSAYEIASRLSYFLWGTMPDNELFALADAGALTDPAIVERQARRMLGDPRARAAIEQFQAGWLALEYGGELQKDKKRFPAWGDELRVSITAETPRFVQAVILEGDGRFETLLGAQFALVDRPLARLYGLELPPEGVVARAAFDPAAGRAGILTQAFFLAKNASPVATSPTRRGKVLREQLLCQILPPPPPDTDMTPPKPKPNESVREQISEHAIKLACSECHDKIDPLGFALEGFDAIGRKQENDGGKPVDTSGTLEDTDVDGPFVGARELAALLTKSEVARKCFSRQMFRFALGRLELPGEPSLERAHAAFATSGHNVRELMVALTTTEAFLNVVPGHASHKESSR